MDNDAGRPARVPRRRVDGVVLVDKPAGLTSNAVLQRVRRAYRALKAGHTGTLDPLASGLLPICLGEATKFSLGLLDADKSYRADLRLGITTETGDAEGAVLREVEVKVDQAQIEHVLPAFRGDILQVPHKYSAIKRDGRALYSYARAGEAIEVAPRPVRIHALEIERWDPPVLTLRVVCSKGTYIRSLGEDIGAVLGCGGHLSALRRLSVGRFGIDQAIGLDTLENMTEAGRDATLRPIESLVEAFPVIALAADDAAKFRHGRKLALAPGPMAAGTLVAVREQERMIPGDGGFLGVARIEIESPGTMLVPARLVSAPEAVPE